tara:strand:+ start:757 stop:1017 length:261 start_codon:yes stop_codon:yes gene_type:complete
MEIDLTKGKPMYVDAIYSCHLGFDLDDLEIDWTKVERLWCKYGTLTIIMKDGTEHDIQYSTEGESDYKWPLELKIYDEEYNELYSE